jgi:hypothetical protein
MTGFNRTVLSVLALKAGESYAKAHMAETGEILGAFLVADALGFERNSLEWNMAVAGAYEVYKNS